MYHVCLFLTSAQIMPIKIESLVHLYYNGAKGT